MNTIESIAAKINSFADQFKITAEAVEVTSYQQMGPNVRVFFKLNRTIGKSPEQIAKLTQKVRLLNELVVDPFGAGAPPVVPEVIDKPVTSFNVTLPASITVGDTTNVVPVIAPVDADDKTFTVTANPTGIVDILNGGTMLRGAGVGSTQLTITANGGAVAPVTTTIEVVAVPVTNPTSVTAEIISDDFTGTEAIVGDIFSIVAEVLPAEVGQEVTMTILTPLTIQQVGEEFTCGAVGEGSIEIASVIDPSVKTTVTIQIQA